MQNKQQGLKRTRGLFRLDENVLRGLFDAYWGKLLAFCYRHIADREVAMELVQDIFCTLWERRDSLQINTDISHYLFGVARNKIALHYRKAAAQQRHCTQQGFCMAVNNTQETIDFNDLNRYVSEQVNRLPCRCREVYTLSRNSGLSIPEIAAQLELSEKTVEAHLSKALKFLRAQLHRQR